MPASTPWNDRSLTIRQSGATLSGNTELGGSVSGTVSDPRRVKITFQDDNGHAVTLDGVANDTIDTIPAQCNHVGTTGTVSLVRQ